MSTMVIIQPMNDEGSNKLVRRTIASNVRSLRKSRRHSQLEFAEMTGINRSYYNQIEQGKANMSLDVLVKIADGLDVPLASLFEGLEGVPPRNLTPLNTYYVVKLPDV